MKFSSTTKVAILGLIAIVALFFFYRVRGVLWPFLWAIIVAYVLYPSVDWVASRTRWSKSTPSGTGMPFSVMNITRG